MHKSKAGHRKNRPAPRQKKKKDGQHTYTQDTGPRGVVSSDDDAAVEIEQALERLRPKRLNEGDRVERRRAESADDGWSLIMDNERRGFSGSMVGD